LASLWSALVIIHQQLEDKPQPPAEYAFVYENAGQEGCPFQHERITVRRVGPFDGLFEQGGNYDIDDYRRWTRSRAFEAHIFSDRCFSLLFVCNYCLALLRYLTDAAIGITIGTYMLYSLLGVTSKPTAPLHLDSCSLGISTFVGLGVTMLLTPLNQFAGHSVIYLQKMVMSCRDERVALTNEVRFSLKNPRS